MRIGGYTGLDLKGYDIGLSPIVPIYDDEILATCESAIKTNKALFAYNVTHGTDVMSPVPCFCLAMNEGVRIHGLGEPIEVFPTAAQTIIKPKKSTKKGE